MILENHKDKIKAFHNLEMLAHQVVEGFISGMHKSPFHGFSSEFAEHKIYNVGESTKNIDWKLFAKTDRLYTKTFQEETNLRCHFIIDNSSSMHYPILEKNELFYKSKIGFSVLASAVLMNLLKKQRDAVGLSIYSDKYEFYTSEKGSDRHHRMILAKLEEILTDNKKQNIKTDTTTYLHQIAENIHRRSMIVLFTDMFQQEDNEGLFKALQHLKHNKHKVIVFHIYNKKKELNLSFDSAPKKFIDVETGEYINLYTDQIKDIYEKNVMEHFKNIEKICQQYQIKYVPVDVDDNFEKIILTYLSEKQKFR